MSVDVHTTVGVGFKVSDEDLRAYLGPDVEEYGVDELLETRFSKEFSPLLDYEVGGSYMDGDVEYVIAVKRFTERLNAYEDCGVFGLEKPVLTLEERIAVSDAGWKIFADEPVVGQFVAILVS